MYKITSLFFFSFIFIFSIHAQTWNVDDASEYKIEKADIILKVKIMHSFYMTDVMTYQCEVLSVQKGNFGDKELTFEIVYPGNSKKIEQFRMEVLTEGNTVLVGFRKDPDRYLEGIKVSGVDYAYFMSKKIGR
jgi:hypothetical protein